MGATKISSRLPVPASQLQAPLPKRISPGLAVPPIWMRSEVPVAYIDAVSRMEQRVDAILSGDAPETIWLLEHEPVITAGTSASECELLDHKNIPVVTAGRGGRYTLHGPGQRIVYVMLDLTRRRRDVRALIQALETWVSAALLDIGVVAGPRDGRVGLWVDRSADKGVGHEDKIAAIGLRLRRWISFHGISINVNMDISEFNRIVPCGIDDSRYGVTSLADLGRKASMIALDEALAGSFTRTIGRLLPTTSY